ncbi:hypothetical protein B2J93_5619 [Marssonina coronariae]|uniref:DUF3295 domain-containing protein n=1 Tax=Diplocarpon coronariae TaxID=2795749 RepID=A0A218Z3A5_9HELO|nr:hypothetical protein B2J93_5619 [Marssonina coronariae]
MLASELTVSLRQHLLWERKQKSQTANAVLKRRHTAQDVANLRQYPDQVYMDPEGSHKSTWDDYYGQGLGDIRRDRNGILAIGAGVRAGERGLWTPRPQAHGSAATFL